jgi:predicted enzyme related to lactoylglutathione lyase
MSIQIKDVAYVFHPVTDIPRAKAFYGTLLGLKATLEMEFAPGVWWIEYDVAGVALAVSNAMPGAEGGGASLVLEVADFDEALSAVRAAGVALSVEPQDFQPCRMFGINSPDGHSIMFHRLKA